MIIKQETVKSSHMHVPRQRYIYIEYIVCKFSGMQGHLWTEIVRTSEQMDFMNFPRVLALAERAWHKAEWEEFEVQYPVVLSQLLNMFTDI